MPRHSLIWLSAAVMLSTTLEAQSLGEIARQRREKKNMAQDSPSPASSQATSKRVYTDDDMPKSSPPPVPKEGKYKASAAGASKTEDKQRVSEAELEKKIRTEKQAIAALQQEIDELEPTIHYVENNRNIYTNAPEYNAHQKAKQEEVAAMKKELEQHRTTLGELQEKARQAGLGNSVYQ